MEPFSIDPAVRFAVFDGELKPEEIYVPHKSTATKVKVPHIVLSEEEAVSQGWYFKKKSRSRIRLTKYTGSESDVIIPSQIGEYTVNELKRRLFTRNRSTACRYPILSEKSEKNVFGLVQFRESLLLHLSQKSRILLHLDANNSEKSFFRIPSA